MLLVSRRVVIIGVVILLWASTGVRAGYQVTNLASDIAGLAKITDPNLKNPWGVSSPPNGPFWVSDQANNTATLYSGSGSPLSLIVSIPTVNGAPNGPTGQVFNNNTSDFLIDGRGAFFLFANLNGQISGFNLGSSAQTVISSPNAVYTGLAIGQVGSNNILFAADASGNKIDVYNAFYNNLNSTTYAGSFVDPNLPTGFKVFDIQNIGNFLYVTYDNGAGGTTASNGGIVAEFGLNGHFIKQLISNGAGGPLEDPWGVTLAPAGFGQFGGDLLVGDKESGQINAFNPTTGAFQGLVATVTNNPASTNNGLWSLSIGTGAVGSDPNTLYAFAGINNETDGLIVTISAVPEPSSAILVGIGGAFAFAVARRRRALDRG
jgi:uncharacterized protein (TIGR03118 family)